VGGDLDRNEKSGMEGLSSMVPEVGVGLLRPPPVWNCLVNDHDSYDHPLCRSTSRVDAVAVIARTGFFVLCSVFKERSAEKAQPELGALAAGLPPSGGGSSSPTPRGTRGCWSVWSGVPLYRDAWRLSTRWNRCNVLLGPRSVRRTGRCGER